MLRGQASGTQQSATMNGVCTLALYASGSKSGVDVSTVLDAFMPAQSNSGSFAPPSTSITSSTSFETTTSLDNGLDLLSALASGSMPSGYPASTSGMSPLFPPTSSVERSPHLSASTGRSQSSPSGLSPPSASPSGNGSDGPARSPSASVGSPQNNVDPFMVGFDTNTCWPDRRHVPPMRTVRDYGVHPIASSSDLLDAAVGTPYYPDNQQNLVFSSWPEDLPAPDLLRHL